MAKRKRKTAVKAVVKPEEAKVAEEPKDIGNVAPPPAEDTKTTPEPPKEKVLPPLEHDKVLWLTVCFSNGRRWKIGAKHVARRIANSATKNDEPSEVTKQKWQAVYAQSFRYPKLLMQELSSMNWQELSQNAVAFEAAKEVDYMQEFKGAIKGFILEHKQKEKMRPAKLMNKVNLPPLEVDPDQEEPDPYKTVGSGDED